MKRRIWMSVTLLVLASAGWAAHRYKITAGEAFAEFSTHGVSDSRATTVRNVYAWASVDAGCAPDTHGHWLGSDIHKGPEAMTKPVKIGAGKPFTFTLVYTEARFNGTRQCGVTGTFTPAAGRRYEARIETEDNVERCSLGIFDVTDAEQRVEFEMPEKTCLVTAKGQMPNGRPLWTTFKVTTAP